MGFSAVVIGAAAGSLRWAQAVLVMGVVAPFVVRGWWRLLPVLADRRDVVGDLAAFGHARHSWSELAQQLGLALVDPRHAWRLMPAGAGAASAGSGMVIDPGEAGWIVPKLRFRFRRDPRGWTVAGRLVGGLTPEDFAKRVPSLVHAWRAHSVTVSSRRRGWVELTVLRTDPLSAPVPALAVAAWPDLRALPLGRGEDGAAWLLRLLGRHVLIAGATGAGKGSVQWSLIRALCGLIRDGLVQVWTADPKRMEFAAGRALFARYEYAPEAMVKLVEDAAALMEQRAERLAGGTRQHEPTPADPLVVVNVDELGFLTAYQPDRKLRERFNAALARLLTQGRAVGVLVVAAVQDPRKETVPMRALFPTRIALRLDEPSQVDLVLGDGALARGAACHEIPADESTGAGIGYVLSDGDPAPRRVRAGWVSDQDIRTMASTYAHSCEAT